MIPMDHPPVVHRTYATCYDLRGTTADGSSTHPGVAASNFLAAGTHIRLVGRAFFGRRHFVIHDTGRALSDGHLDLWRSGGCARWGRRQISFRVVTA
jgi:3D (Asp-Asp-Asp) domain-containing protein